MRLQPHWLKTGVMLPVALAMLVSGVILLVLLLAVLSHNAKQEFDRDFATIRGHWHNELAHHSLKLRTLGESLMSDATLRTAFSTGDSRTLGHLVPPLFTRLQRDYHIASLGLVTTDGQLLLGLHHPVNEGEQMNSSTLQQAMASGMAQSGLELDPWNTLRLLEALPWRHEGQLHGYIILGETFAHLASDMDRLFGMQHLVAVPAPHPDAASLTLLPSSLTTLPATLTQLLQEQRLGELERGIALERAEKWFFAGAIPLTDAANSPLGWLITLRDVSDVRATLLLGAGVIAAVTLIILVLLLAFLHHVTRQAERVMQESERELQHSLDMLETAHAEWVESFDAIAQPIFIHDEKFRVIRANRSYAEHAGLSFHDLLGTPYWEAFPRNGGPLPGCLQAMEGGTPCSEEEVRLADGSVYISRAYPVHDNDGGYRFSIHVLQDVTQLEQLTSALQHEMRARRTISASNQALIHADSAEGLLQEVCRIATEEGGYRLAWAAYKVDDAACSLQPSGAAGITLAELAQWPLNWSAQGAQELLSAHAIRSGEVQVRQDIQHDASCPHSAALARQYGYAAAAAFPLRTGNEAWGVLFIAAVTPHAFTTAEIAVLQELSDDLAYGITALRNRQERATIEHAHLGTLERLKGLLGNTVLALSTAMEARDPYTAGHQHRVMDLAMGIARELGWEEERIEALGIAALVHDVGNIYVPAEIISKPGKLSPVEFELVKSHPQIGYKILSAIDFPWPIADMVLQHHEMLDGSGYPAGLKNGSILPEAQIIAIAGMVEAMASHRPYRPALGITAALEELERHRGGKFDPHIVDICLHLFRAKGYHLVRSGEGLATL